MFFLKNMGQKYYLFKIKQETCNTAESKMCRKFLNDKRLFKELFPLGFVL